MSEEDKKPITPIFKSKPFRIQENHKKEMSKERILQQDNCQHIASKKRARYRKYLNSLVVILLVTLVVIVTIKKLNS